MTRTKKLLVGGILTAMAALQFNCTTPIPSHEMTLDERKGDMSWLISIFEQNYAFIAYKEKTFNFNYAQMKSDFIARAEKEQTNEQFYALMQEFVAKFGDAHTSLSFTPSGQINDSRVAFLGFLGERKGDSVMVTEILPMVSKDYLAKRGIAVGSIIKKFNGKPMWDAIKETVVPYRNLGNDLANYTALANGLFFRNSLRVPVPTEAGATLTVVSGDKEYDTTIPWVVADAARFSMELVTIQDEPSAEQGEKKELTENQRRLDALARQYNVGFRRGNEDRVKLVYQVTYTESANGNPVSFPIAMRDTSGRIMSVPRAAIAGGKNPLAYFTNQAMARTFVFRSVGDFTTDEKQIATSYTFDSGAIDRSFGYPVLPLNGKHGYPAVIMRVASKTRAGAVVPGKLENIGYVRSYDYEVDPDYAAAELADTLSQFSLWGVEKVVFDNIGNPGGYLETSIKMAQALSNKVINPLQIAVRTNDNWYNDFRNAANGSKFPDNQGYLDIVKVIQGARAAKERLTKALPMTIINPKMLAASSNAAVAGLKIANIQDEMCASSCDIFSALLKANFADRLVLVGKPTMGAGGNVTSKDLQQAPASGGVLRQTESAVIRGDAGHVGEYLENNGVAADVDLDLTTNWNMSSMRTVMTFFGPLQMPGGPPVPNYTPAITRAVDALFAQYGEASAANVATGTKQWNARMMKK